jgi:hypothetical protein
MSTERVLDECPSTPLEPEDSPKAQVLSGRGIAVAWITRDRTGARLEYQPADALDPVFHLRRARAKVVHAWRLFRNRTEAVRHSIEALQGDDEAEHWANAIPSEDFDDLVRRFGVSPSA